MKTTVYNRKIRLLHLIFIAVLFLIITNCKSKVPTEAQVITSTTPVKHPNYNKTGNDADSAEGILKSENTDTVDESTESSNYPVSAVPSNPRSSQKDDFSEAENTKTAKDHNKLVYNVNVNNEKNSISHRPTIITSTPSHNSNKSPAISSDEYKVILATNKNIFLNETCELRVWIGPEGLKVSFSDGMATDEIKVPANTGQYARITPYAPDFEIKPLQMTCIQIDPSGSDVRFSLRPLKSGNLKVSANIELFNNPNCEGAPVPKTANTLSVEVKIDKSYVIDNESQKLLAIVWEKFLSFWGILITLLFSTVLFAIRGLIKRKTGYDDKEKEV